MVVSDESKYYTVEEAEAQIQFLQEAFLRVLEGDRRWPRGLFIERHPDAAPTPEEAHHAAQTLEEFLGELDAHARDVVEWQLAGYTKAEIQSDFGLDDTAYDTITRRIRRSLAKLAVEE